MKTLLAFLTLLASGAVFAQSGVEIVAQRQGVDLRSGMAAPVTADVILTKAILLSDSDSLAVIDAQSGARLQARTLHRADGLALAQVPGANFTPVTVAIRRLHAGEEIRLLTAPAPRGGRVLSVSPDGGFTHDVAYQAAEAGSMLLNRCGELSGFNLDKTAGIINIKPLGAESPVAAQSFDTAVALMQTHGVAFQSAATPCPTAEEQLAAELEQRQQAFEEQKKAAEEAEKKAAEELKVAEEAAKKAADERKAAEETAKKAAEEAEKKATDELKAAEEAAKKVADELKAAEERTEEARKQAEEAARNLQAEQEARAQALAEAGAEKSRRVKTVYLGAAGAVALLLILLFAAKRLRQRKTELQAARARFTDVLLTGHDAGGNPYRLRIDGGALIQAQDGLVIGKNSEQAQLVIASMQISRAHARVWVENDVLMITDLGSSNGTRVNGAEVATGQRAALREGDEIAFGGIFLTVKFLRA